MVDDFLVARAAAHTSIAVCERLLDNPTDPDALAATRQFLDDNPELVHQARSFIASLPD